MEDRNKFQTVSGFYYCDCKIKFQPGHTYFNGGKIKLYMSKKDIDKGENMMKHALLSEVYKNTGFKNHCKCKILYPMVEEN